MMSHELGFEMQKLLLHQKASNKLDVIDRVAPKPHVQRKSLC